MPRASGWIAVILIDLGSVALIWPQSAKVESPRPEAWRLAQEAIKESETRKGIPQFIAWSTTREIFPCGSHPVAEPRRASVHNLLDESFHYNPRAAARLCEPLIPGIGTAPLDRA